MHRRVLPVENHGHPGGESEALRARLRRRFSGQTSVAIWTVWDDKADLDGDGFVDSNDIAGFAASFGRAGL